MSFNRLAIIFLALNVIAISGFQLYPERNRRVLGETTETATVTYPLLIGWNLVHFPLTPTEFTTAAGLVETIAKKGGYVTTIATWENGAWKEYVQRGATAYSPDFSIEPGKAYFLRSHRQLEWQVSGTPVSVTTLALKPGWNTIGLTLGPDRTASNLLSTLNATSYKPQATSSPERAQEIDRWLSGNWQVFVKRIFTTDNIQEYGDNFPLNSTEGYMIKANDYLELQLESN